ncbi:MAG: hypothetical protein KBF62_01855 [Candidatus Pacebacteria bacterium]|nr:hypothetical protein [Candidatus Paceibacterota bacterium]MBP9058364.1 hypothetical protein [Candidatus Paceibacterota bacterium]MBP9770078.1 hypothetical protein [Candidatus Paceibacterota bacterium]
MNNSLPLERLCKEIKQIKDFRIVLKDMEPYVKDGNYLIKGREFTNFSLRPREAWANWLICVVLRKLQGDDITFAEDTVGDGFLIDEKNSIYIPTEHVSALENPHNRQPKGEDRIIEAINKKIKRGPKYAKGKILVVFFDGAEEFFRNKIRESIKGKHQFISIFCVGLLTIDKNGYAYIVTEFKEEYGDKSLSFKVQINSDFTNWEISQITA